MKREGIVNSAAVPLSQPGFTQPEMSAGQI